jgi:hypothetical protein
MHQRNSDSTTTIKNNATTGSKTAMKTTITETAKAKAYKNEKLRKKCI